MSAEQRARLLAEMMTWDGNDAEFVVERERIEHGATFSSEAIELLHDELITFVGTRIMRRWDSTHEPPTALRVVITVIAS